MTRALQVHAAAVCSSRGVQTATRRGHNVPALACLPTQTDRQTDRTLERRVQRDTVCVWNTAGHSGGMCSPPVIQSKVSSSLESQPHNDAIHHDGRENKFHIGETDLLQEERVPSQKSSIVTHISWLLSWRLLFVCNMRESS